MTKIKSLFCIDGYRFKCLFCKKFQPTEENHICNGIAIYVGPYTVYLIPHKKRFPELIMPHDLTVRTSIIKLADDHFHCIDESWIYDLDLTPESFLQKLNLYSTLL